MKPLDSRSACFVHGARCPNLDGSDAMSLENFIAEQGITATAERRDSNPHTDEDDWNKDARHWCVFLRNARASIPVPFSQGSAHTEVPTAADVLDCLASDSAGIENARSFEDWCGEYGYDTDSRKAERTFKACEQQAALLKEFLGAEAYETLLWRVERQ